jgi:peptidyl-tRNA hydrolase, PTH1 family
MLKLIVGLGNPGPLYEATRHNVGWAVVEAFARKQGVQVGKIAFEGALGEWRHGDGRVYLLKPLTYMNLSGRSVGRAFRYYKMAPADVIIVYDDLDLPPGKLRLREKGGSGGHNGMKSIIEHLGTEEVARLRIGIGRPAPGWEGADWVLSRFGKEDAPLFAQALEQAVAALETWVADGILTAMNRFNTRA